jgi:hypothetical protein
MVLASKPFLSWSTTRKELMNISTYSRNLDIERDMFIDE